MTTPPPMKCALIAGAGIVGRALVEHLDSLSDWNAIAMSRSARPVPGSAVQLAVDLLDRSAVAAVADDLRDVTHVVYAAYGERATPEEEVAPNLAMLVNLVEAVELAAPRLEHVLLVHGSKWYGSHLGPYPTPAREDQPRHPLPVFYYAQQDWLAERQATRAWSWSAVRPHGIWGFAIGSRLNVMNAVAVYATLMRQMGLPLHFPGRQAAWEAVYQCTEAAHLARAIVWASTSEQARGEAFNITNGDFIRWRHAWPVVASWFGMEVGDVMPFDLARFAAGKESMWAEIREHHDLATYRIGDLTTWEPARRYLFEAGWDQMSAVTKARRAGWTEVVDTYEMIPRQLDRLAAERVIPSRRWAS